MNTFNNIKELLSLLNKEQLLLTEMFSKRNSLEFQKDFALEIIEEEHRINRLINYGVLKENGNCLELADLYLDFFENILEVNEQINLAYVDENIKTIQEQIEYYLNGNNDIQKNKYLRTIKKIFRNIEKASKRNVLSLRRNIENTFKDEPNYKNKKAKLKNYDAKRIAIEKLIKDTFKLTEEGNHTFFKKATDEELSAILFQLKHTHSICMHNLIEIQKQISDYINQVEYKGPLAEKIRKLKYLKDQFSIEADTNIKQVLLNNNALLFETNERDAIKLSLNYLQNDEIAFETIKIVAKKITNRITSSPPITEYILSELLETTNEDEIQINLERVKDNFIATSNELFSFLMNYKFHTPLDFNERVNIFCQLISLYEDEFQISENYNMFNNIEYVVVYPK